MNDFTLRPPEVNMLNRLRSGAISTRETILNVLLRTPEDDVLNTTQSRDVPAPASNMSAALTRVFTQFKDIAIYDDGHTVDYSRLRDSSAYVTYRGTFTQQLRVFNPDALDTCDRKLAFWINLYNALIIDAVISLNIQTSVTEGTLGLVRFFRRAVYDVGGHRVSANDIEHGILRRNRGFPSFLGPQLAPTDPRSTFVITRFDPRIHMALNCASRSCPPLRVYDADTIDAQLDTAAREFVSAETEVDEGRKELHLPSIFNWFEDDFGGRAGVIDFVRRYLPDEDERYKWLSQHSSSVTLVHKPYDWSLNAK